MKKNTIVMLIIVIITIILVLNFNLIKGSALDVGRYYAAVEQGVNEFDGDIVKYLKYSIENNIDFIYVVSLFLLCIMGLDMKIGTVIFMSLYYYAIFRVVNIQHLSKKGRNIVLLYILLSVPVIWTLTISRTTAALSFFFLGVFEFIVGNKRNGVLFLIISLFTHVSMIIFILILIMAFLLSKVNVPYMARNVVLILVALLGYAAPNLLMDFISPYIELTDLRYSIYSNMDIVSPFKASNIGWPGDKIPILFTVVMMVYLSLKDKRKDWTYWSFYIMTLFLLIFIWSNLMMTNRVMMLMPPFLGISLISVIKQEKKSKYYIFAIMGVVIAMGSLYSYRVMFS